MIKFLIKSTNELRVETKDEADVLHKQIQKEAEDNGYTLSAWSETIKEKKSKGEVIDSWVIVKYTFIFNDPKEPEKPLSSIEYNMRDIWTSDEGEEE